MNNILYILSKDEISTVNLTKDIQYASMIMGLWPNIYEKTAKYQAG